MPRPREFDRDEVLDRAIQVFWARGYDRTSVQDLVDAMAIQRGSLYAAFGDKQQLFLEALDRYEARFHEKMRAELGQEGRARPVRERIEAVFRDVVLDCACEQGRRGCFITNTAVGLADGDEKTASRIRANLKRVEEAFADALTEARKRGELGAEQSPRALARFFTNALQGLRVLSRCCTDVDVLQDAVDVTLSVLDPSVSKKHSIERRPA